MRIDHPRTPGITLGASAARAMAAGLVALAGPVGAATDQAEASLLSSFLAMLAALAVVLVLAFVGLRLLRRSQQRGFGAAGPFRVRGTLPVGVREKVVLIEVTGRLLVIGVTPQQITLLRDSAAFDPGGQAEVDRGAGAG